METEKNFFNDYIKEIKESITEYKEAVIDFIDYIEGKNQEPYVDILAIIAPYKKHNKNKGNDNLCLSALNTYLRENQGIDIFFRNEKLNKKASEYLTDEITAEELKTQYTELIHNGRLWRKYQSILKKFFYINGTKTFLSNIEKKKFSECIDFDLANKWEAFDLSVSLQDMKADIIKTNEVVNNIMKIHETEKGKKLFCYLKFTDWLLFGIINNKFSSIRAVKDFMAVLGVKFDEKDFFTYKNGFNKIKNKIVYKELIAKHIKDIESYTFEEYNILSSIFYRKIPQSEYIQLLKNAISS